MVMPGDSAVPGKEPTSRQLAPTLPATPKLRSPSWGLPEWFVIAQVVGPALLILPGAQRIRIAIRVSVFGISLLGLVLYMYRPRVTRRHPSGTLLATAIGYLALMILHPATNTVMAGLAQTGMYLAVAAPIFWAPRYFLGDYRRLARVLTILWILNGASAVVGILQVRDPATWMPAEFSSVVMGDKLGLAKQQYRMDDGRMAIRPPGLGDCPGAACGAGLFAASVGIAYLGLPVSNARKLLGLALGMAGVSVIFLSHVRSSLVVLIGSAAVYLTILVIQKRVLTALVLAVSMAACGVIAFQYAASLGGKSTIDRFATLLEDDPLTVYGHSSRLGMIANTFDSLLIDYPLGAGLGRWGMMRGYFGNENNQNSPGIWVEVQFAAWVIDGGGVLLSLTLIALVVAVHRLLSLSSRHPSSLLRQWGGVIIMLSAAPVALMFSYTPFNSQIGMQFWLLIGAFEGVAQGEGRGRSPRNPG